LTTINPKECKAAQPLTSADGESFFARLERKQRIPPMKLIRPTLNQDFAVLLMRSSYNALDELDCVPMDQFQKDFFFIRSAEYLNYVNHLGPGLVKQGELSDPYYFDFISFAQYATIFREISIDPAVVFEEQQPVLLGEDNQEFVSKVIRRNEAYMDNSKLPMYHDELVGTKILDKINETFASTKAAISSFDSNASVNDVVKSLQEIVDIFLINGFAFGGTVSAKSSGENGKASGSTIDIMMNSPANLWSRKALLQKKANPTNDFVLKTAKVLLNRNGFQVSSTIVKFTDNEEITTITIR
jgi:hypothetical protein